LTADYRDYVRKRESPQAGMFLLNSKNKECASENERISKYVLHELQAICCSPAQYLMSEWVLSPLLPIGCEAIYRMQRIGFLQGLL
jgi:hypothetical protein